MYSLVPQQISLATGVAAFARRLREWPEIRLYVDGTPNFGHQGQSLIILKRIIHDYDYDGCVTVILETRRASDDLDTSEKLALLLGLPSVDLPQSIGRAQLRWVPAQQVTELARCPFGFSGGVSSQLGRSLNALVRSDVFLAVQPFHWRYAHDLIAFDDASTPLPISDWDNRRLERRATRPVISGLTLARRSGAWPSAGRPLSACVYGIRDLGVSGLPADRLFIITVCAWLEVAQRRSCGVVLQNFDGGAVEGLAGAMRRLSGGQDECVAQADDLQCIVPRDIRQRLRFTEGNVRDDDRRWLADAPGRLLFVQVGFAPQDQYHAAMLQADLPLVFEGQSSASAAVSLGVPYVQLPDAGLPVGVEYARLPTDLRQHRGAIRQAENLAAQLATAAAAKSPASVATDQLVAFAEECQDPSSRLARYFGALRQFYACPGADKLDAALTCFTHVLDARPASAAPSGWR